MKNLAILLLVVLLPHLGRGAIIQASNRIDWVVGKTVGVQGGIPARTGTVRDISEAPYNAPFSTDGSMPESALTAFAAVISDSASNDVIYIPPGKAFNITNSITLDKAGVSIRGGGSNSVLFGSIIFGRSASGDYVYSITNVGAGAKGTTNNLVINSLTDADGFSIAAGDMLKITSIIDDTDPAFPYISATGFKRILSQHVIVHSVNGHTVSITAPLVWDFTNAPRFAQMNKFGYGGAFRAKQGMSLENFTLLGTNHVNNWTTPYTLIAGGMLRDCWITNLNVWYPNNYAISIDDSVNVTIEGNNIGKAQSQGSSHSGVISANTSGALIQNNIIADVIQAGMMFNDGFSGNAVFANYFTNNTQNGDIICHNAHPVMNLFEANQWPVKFMMDGYFGSASHQTLFRNWHHGSIAFKRWITYMQVVGNVLGVTNGYDFNYLFSEEYNYVSGYPIFDLGFPNIGNAGYIGTNPPIGFNFPGKIVNAFSDALEQFYGINSYSNTGFLITNAPAYPTNALHTNMGIGILSTNMPNPIASGYPLKFQDPINTNKWWPDDGTVILTVSYGGAYAGSGSNVLLNQYIQLSNGWTAYVAGQNAYQQLDSDSKFTHLIHGNVSYVNNEPQVDWDAGTADHDIPASLLYPDGPPGWWGTNRWPAYGPDQSPYIAKLPAENTYLGIDNGSNTNPPATPTSFGSYGCSNQIRFVWTPSGNTAAGFIIKRGTTSGVLTTVTNLGTSVYGWTNIGLVDGTEYFYTITASNQYGFSAESSEISDEPEVAPDVATGLSALAADSKITLSWNAADRATFYAVYRGTSSGSLSLHTFITGTTGYTNTGLANGTTYFYAVQSGSPCGFAGSSSEVSAVPSTGAPVLQGKGGPGRIKNGRRRE